MTFPADNKTVIKHVSQVHNLQTKIKSLKKRYFKEVLNNEDWEDASFTST